MNQDAHSATSASQHSPSQGYTSTGSDSKPKSSSMSQKRASRAGTRSVTTLSAAQLERKRANDREAQRAIRQRTKDHIETLEHRINELTVNEEKTQRRNRELEEENAYLRNRLGNETFAMSVTEAESGDKPTEYSVPASNSSPHPTIARPSSTSTSRSVPMAPLQASQHPDTWRGHGSFPSTGVPTSASFLPDAAQANNAPTSGSWRAQEVGEPHSRIEQASRSFAAGPPGPDRSSWIGSAPAYAYQVRSSDRPPSGYHSATPSMSYPTPSQPPQFQTIPAAANELPPVAATFHGSGIGPQADYQQMPSYSTSQQSTFHEQPQSHTTYQVAPAQVQSAGDFHGVTSNVHRRGLAPPAYNPAAGPPQFINSQSTHGQSLPLAYREGTNPHQYSYDT